MSDQKTVRVIQTRAYLRPAGYRLLSEVMKDQRRLYNFMLEGRRTPYASIHKTRCGVCVENARLDDLVKLHKRDCADADAKKCATCADLERDARNQRRKCNLSTHVAACAMCRSSKDAETALSDHAVACVECRARKCGHKIKVKGCSGCYCEIAAQLRTAWKSAPTCEVWQAKNVKLAVQSKKLTEIKNSPAQREEWGGLDAVARRLSVGTLERLDFAFKAFFDRVDAGKSPGYPRFKPAHRFRTVQIYSGANRYLKIYDADTGKGRIEIKGLPTLRFRCPRVPAGQQPIDMKITLKPNGKVWVSMSFKFAHEAVSVKHDGDPKPKPKPKIVVGIDMGKNKRAMLSCGEKLPTRDLTKHRRMKRRLQRKMDRQRRAALNDGRARQEPIRRDGGSYVLGKNGRRRYKIVWLDADGSPAIPSRSYRETRARLARLEMREEVRSRNVLHRWTADIVRRHDFIAVEDLNIRNMTKSAAGTVEEPGSRVAQKRGLNRSILEQQWGKALTFLEYKAESAGIPFMRVDPNYTSQICANCGALKETVRRPVESFVCRSCFNMDDADHNAARNILARGWLQWQSDSGAAEPLPPGSQDTGACARLNGAVAPRLPKTPRTRGSPEARQLTFAL